MDRVVSAFGLFVFIGLAFAFSTNRKAVKWRPVIWGVGLQFVLAVIVLRTSFGFAAFSWLGDMVTTFLNFSDAGAKFVFGEKFTDYFFAFKVLPTIIFFSAFISVMYHFGILQRVVSFVAWTMMRTMGTSGSESLSAAANIFVGQTEAPLLIKPYVSSMTMSELHAVMTGGFATIAGGVMAAYISFGVSAQHLIAASVMSAPAALAISKLLYPESEESVTAGVVSIEVPSETGNAIEAAANGAIDGMKLVLNVAAMMIAFLALLALFNAVLGWAGGLVGLPQLSLEWIFSYLLSPVAWLMGVPWNECGTVGVLLGKKTALNEFIAYADLAAMLQATKSLAENPDFVPAVPVISDRAANIAIYALCGFSNFGSIGIQIGGIGGIAPDRRGDLARIGLRAMIAGSLACFMTACIAGVLL
ncbi:MAG: NupC/NupG family nucleoside CNT transporter [Acidobacteria bacterium]|nr:NupC/NupG family nucleoside CNT transporter [Acidobacteriota bacterium]